MLRPLRNNILASRAASAESRGIDVVNMNPTESDCEPAQVFAIVDCTSFYASCERVFNPAIRDLPVVVLSNNDGCIIARSEEARPLADMGAPYFKFKEKLEEGGARVYSSNYSLYGDMSRRVMTILGTLASEVQVYSIDEAFLGLPHMPYDDLLDYARHIRRHVMRWTGIPVRVGIGQTKTLAKAAQALAKRRKEPVFCLTPEDESHLLGQLPVGEIWGIGRRYATFLTGKKVHTARDFRDCSDGWIRHHMNVVALRTAWELRGKSCLTELLQPPRRSVLRSRSFERKVTALKELEEAVAIHATRAAEELRRHEMVAHLVQTFITTGSHDVKGCYSNTCMTSLPVAAGYTPTLIRAAHSCLRKIYRPGHRYAKAGVVLLDLVPASSVQADLFVETSPRHTALMGAIDGINRRLGTDSVYFAAAQHHHRPWSGRCDLRSPSYTTKWADIPVARTR
jgi:DNA polymerase V